MSVFRDDFDFHFILFFALLMGVKVFHWLYRDRVDYVIATLIEMEQSPQLTRVFYVRMAATMGLLIAIDVGLLLYCLADTIDKGPSMLILFCFEYTILLINCILLSAKFFMNIYDGRLESPWVEKSTYLFYMELSADFFKVVSYVCFFFVVLAYYGLPLHIIRDLFVTLRSFFARLRDMMQFRRALQDLREKYPDATPEELSQGDRVCIICREDMREAKKLNCGHLFHFNCLRTWLERQQSCPTCRRPVLDDNPRQRHQQVPPPAAINRPANGQPNAAQQNQLEQQQNPIQRNAFQANGPHQQGNVPNNLPNPRAEGQASPPVQSNGSASSRYGPVGIQTDQGVSTAVPVILLPSQSLGMVGSSLSEQVLSDSQLSALETMERQNINAQLEFLRGIQEQINGVMQSMTRYEEILGRMAARRTPTHSPVQPRREDSDSQGNASPTAEGTVRRRQETAPRDTDE